MTGEEVGASSSAVTRLHAAIGGSGQGRDYRVRGQGRSGSGVQELQVHVILNQHSPDSSSHSPLLMKARITS